jgi:hypothetical protein
MNTGIYNMQDVKVMTGMFATASSAFAGWVEAMQPVASFTVTVVVGALTAWYTWERAAKLRKERKNVKDKDKGK